MTTGTYFIEHVIIFSFTCRRAYMSTHLHVYMYTNLHVDV